MLILQLVSLYPLKKGSDGPKLLGLLLDKSAFNVLFAKFDSVAELLVQFMASSKFNTIYWNAVRINRWSVLLYKGLLNLFFAKSAQSGLLYVYQFNPYLIMSR